MSEELVEITEDGSIVPIGKSKAKHTKPEDVPWDCILFEDHAAERKVWHELFERLDNKLRWWKNKAKSLKENVK